MYWLRGGILIESLGDAEFGHGTLFAFVAPELLVLADCS